jgi:hypothetical protein
MTAAQLPVRDEVMLAQSPSTASQQANSGRHIDQSARSSPSLLLIGSPRQGIVSLYRSSSSQRKEQQTQPVPRFPSREAPESDRGR